MTARLAGLALLLTCSSCVKVPIRNVYCDNMDYTCGDPNYPVCDISRNECVPTADGGTDAGADLAAADLATPRDFATALDFATPPDMAACLSSASCGNAMPICASGMCRACSGSSDDAQCAVHDAATPHCGTSGQCVVCRAASVATDCTSAAMPVCDTSGSCRACSAAADNAQCAQRSASTPYCDVPSGHCVACTPGSNAQSSECSGTMPICATNNTCRGCQSHSECTSVVCKPDGSCALASDVAYVNDSIACMDTLHASTPAAPYCQVNYAANNAGKAFVVVAGSATAYNPVSVTSTSGTISLTIIGPGKAASPPATVAGAGAASPNGFALTTSGGNAATIVLDGLELIGGGGANPGTGVLCSQIAGTATLTVRNSSIHGSGSAGVSSTSCAVTVDKNLIGPSNTGGGIVLSGATTYTITNNIISGNGSGGASTAGVSISNLSTGTFAFNTVAKNIVAAGVGGIDCGTGSTKLIQDSIAWMSTTSGGTQLGPQCTLSNVVTAAGDDNQGTMSTLAPAFVSATDFHLKTNQAANQACCVDKIATPGTPNADHDVDGTHRPLGATGKWTIGANELAQ